MTQLTLNIVVRLDPVYMSSIPGYIAYFDTSTQSDGAMSASIYADGNVAVQFPMEEGQSCDLSFHPGQEGLTLDSVIIGAPAPAVRYIFHRDEEMDKVGDTPFGVRWDGKALVLTDTFSDYTSLGNWEYTLLMSYEGNKIAGDPEITNLGTGG